MMWGRKSRIYKLFSTSSATASGHPCPCWDPLSQSMTGFTKILFGLSQYMFSSSIASIGLTSEDDASSKCRFAILIDLHKHHVRSMQDPDYVLSYQYGCFIYLYPPPYTDLSSSGELCTPLSSSHFYTVSFSSNLVLSLSFRSSYYMTKDQRATEWSDVRTAQRTPHTKAAQQRVERRAIYWKMFPSFQYRVYVPHSFEATKLFDVVSKESLGDGLHKINEHIIFEHSNLKAFIKK